MKNKILSSIVCIFLIPSVLFANELAKGKKDTIIISKVKVSSSIAQVAKEKKYINDLLRFMSSLRAEFINSVNQYGVFQIVERERKDEIEQEQAYSDVVVDQKDEDMAKMFKMKGAKFILLPEIDAFEIRENRVNYNAIARTSVTRTVYASVAIRIVDTTTGEVLSQSPSMELSSSNSVSYARLGTSVASDKTLLNLAKDISKNLIGKVVEYLSPAKILIITGKQVLVNKGSVYGFKKGQKVEFYATEDVKDDDTGEIFQNEVLVGEGEIERIDDKKSFATIKGEDMGIGKGCIVRIKK